MKTNEKNMQLIRYPEGRVACVHGQIVKLFGLMIGFEWMDGVKENPIRTIRIPLKNECMQPMKAVKDNCGSSGLYICSRGDEVTLAELMDMLQYKIYLNDVFDMSMTFRELDKLGVKLVNSNNASFIPLVMDDDDSVFCHGCYIPDLHLIRDLALLQKRLDLSVIFDTTCCTAEGDIFTRHLGRFLDRIKLNGLYYGDSGNGTVYYDGTYMFTGNGRDAVSITSEEFKQKFDDVGVILQPASGMDLLSLYDKNNGHKENDSWSSGLMPGLEPEDGDFLFVYADSSIIFINKVMDNVGSEDRDKLYCYASCFISNTSKAFDVLNTNVMWVTDRSGRYKIRPATDDEKKYRCLQSLEDNGYRWNAVEKEIVRYNQ